MEALSSGLVAVIGSTMGIVIFGEIIPQVVLDVLKMKAWRLRPREGILYPIPLEMLR